MYNYDTRRLISILQLWLNGNNHSDYVKYPYLFAHVMGFIDLVGSRNTMELMDRLKGSSEKLKALCLKYYYSHVIITTHTTDMETIAQMMETASFADAWIGLTHKQRHQVSYNYLFYCKLLTINNRYMI